jgi:hypothetical protein
MLSTPAAIAARAETGAQAEQDDSLVPGQVAVVQLTEQSQVGVVVDDRRYAELGTDGPDEGGAEDLWQVERADHPVHGRGNHTGQRGLNPSTAACGSGLSHQDEVSVCSAATSRAGGRVKRMNTLTRRTHAGKASWIHLRSPAATSSSTALR